MISNKARVALKKLGVKLIAAALILLGLFFLADLSFRPIIEKVNAYECHRAVNAAVNSAVMEEIERQDADYSALVTLTENNDGEVISVQSNAVGINRLRTGISQRIERELGRLPYIDIDIPIGTLTGLQLLHGKGLCIGMTMHPTGSVGATIISEFTEAGINQTRHRIIIEIDASVDAVIPGYSTRVNVKTSVVAAETIIIGRVPDAYTRVVSSDNDLIGTLEDYGATL